MNKRSPQENSRVPINWMRVVTFILGLVLLGLVWDFGQKGQPAEMGLMGAAGFLFLAFLGLDRFSELGGMGFTAKIRELREVTAEAEQKIDEANATLEQVRRVAILSGELGLVGAARANRWGSGYTVAELMSYLAQHEQTLYKLGLCGDAVWVGTYRIREQILSCIRADIHHPLMGSMVFNDVQGAARRENAEASLDEPLPRFKESGNRLYGFTVTELKEEIRAKNVNDPDLLELATYWERIESPPQPPKSTE